MKENKQKKYRKLKKCNPLVPYFTETDQIRDSACFSIYSTASTKIIQFNGQDFRTYLSCSTNRSNKLNNKRISKIKNENEKRKRGNSSIKTEKLKLFNEK